MWQGVQGAPCPPHNEPHPRTPHLSSHRNECTHAHAHAHTHPCLAPLRRVHQHRPVARVATTLWRAAVCPATQQPASQLCRDTVTAAAASLVGSPVKPRVAQQIALVQSMCYKCRTGATAPSNGQHRLVHTARPEAGFFSSSSPLLAHQRRCPGQCACIQEGKYLIQRQEQRLFLGGWSTCLGSACVSCRAVQRELSWYAMQRHGAPAPARQQEVTQLTFVDALLDL